MKVALQVHPRWRVGDFVSFVEAGDVVDARRLEIYAAMLPSVDVAAEDKSRALRYDGLCQFRRAEMLGVGLERTVNIAAGDMRRRVRNKDIKELPPLTTPSGSI